MTDAEIIASIESGKIRIGFLYRHSSVSHDGKCQAGDWEWYEAGTPGQWHRGPTLRECLTCLKNATD